MFVSSIVVKLIFANNSHISRFIRDKERSHGTEDNYMLPPDDPVEIEYQCLKVDYAVVFIKYCELFLVFRQNMQKV